MDIHLKKNTIKSKPQTKGMLLPVTKEIYMPILKLLQLGG